MYQIKEEDVQMLLDRLRQIRQVSGEAISMLEHMKQLQELNHDLEDYDPDDYLERWIPCVQIPSKNKSKK